MPVGGSGARVPTEDAFLLAFGIGAGAALLGGVLILLIPRERQKDAWKQDARQKTIEVHTAGKTPPQS